MNDADAASINRKLICAFGMPCCSADSAAMGNINAAAALLPTMLHRTTVARYTATKIPGLPVPKALPAATKFCAMAVATPDCSIAADIPKAAAMVTMTSHFTAALAASCVKHPVANMTPEANNAATNKSSAPATKTAIMTTAVPRDGNNLSNCGGAESSISETNANAASRLWFDKNDVDVSNNKTSPACKTMSPIRA